MQHNINDYTEVVEYLDSFIGVTMKRQVEDNTHLFEYNHTTYLLTDNGGETNVIAINQDSISIPHTSHSIDVTNEVLAYRIATYITKGYSDINWNVNQKIIDITKKEYKTNKLDIINYVEEEVK